MPINWTPEDLAELRDRAKVVMRGHLGRDNPITMAAFHEAVFHRPVGDRVDDTRDSRILVRALRHRGWRLCSTSNRGNPGYYLARNKEEFMEFIARYRRRPLAGLSQIAGMMRVALPRLMGQLEMEFAAHDRA